MYLTGRHPFGQVAPGVPWALPAPGLGFEDVPVPVPVAAPLPRVVAFRFRTTGTTDAANCCAVCAGGPLNLGVGIVDGGHQRARNAMELQFILSDHRRGLEYDITRTKRSSTWERVAGAWRRLHAEPMGTSDDHFHADECLTPQNRRLFVIDRPGWNTALPAPAGTRFVAAPGTAILTDAAATDVVRRLSLAEWPMARHQAEGIPWTPLQLPPFRNGAPRRFIFWHNIVWLTRDGAGRWILDAARSRIARGSLSAAVVNSPP